MLNKIIKMFVSNISSKNKDKTMVYLTQASTYFLISLGMALIASYISIIPARDSMIATQIATTFAFILGSIQVFIRFLDVMFEAIRHDFDNRNKA